jgi:hypothetical protein
VALKSLKEHDNLQKILCAEILLFMAGLNLIKFEIRDILWFSVVEF